MTLIDRLQGALTAIVTPFDADGAVDVDALTRFVQAQIEHGIDGLVPCGTTGETPTLSADEQERVVRTTIEANAGRVPIVAGTGSNNTAGTVAHTKRALEWGIDAALVVVPYYNKPTQEGIYRHYKAVYEETGAPIIAYNVPGRTVVDLAADTLGRLAEDGLVIGVKDATANMTRTSDNFVAVGRDRPFAMLSGDDFTILPFVAGGGRGVISVVSNVAPGDTSRLVKATAAGNFDEARPLNDRIIALSRALFMSSNPIPTKAALALAGWTPKHTRLPLVTADAEIEAAMKVAINAYRGEAPDADVSGWMA